MPIIASRRPSKPMGAELKIIRTAAETGSVERFPAAKASLPGGGEVVRLRDAAFDLFAKRGLPHRRVEELEIHGSARRSCARRRRSRKSRAPEAVALALSSAGAFADADVTRISFVNGHFAPDASDRDRLPEGVE